MRVIALIALMGCTYTSPGGGDDTSPQPDGPMIIPDGPTMCPNVYSECAAPALLRSCDVKGMPSHDTECNWGCMGASPDAKCGEFVPAGGGVLVTDLDATGLADFTVNGDVDGANGSISGTMSRGSGMNVISGVDYLQRGGIGILRAKSWHFTGSNRFQNTLAFAIVSDGPIVIDATIDARGPCTGQTQGPGGFAGGVKSAKGSGGGPNGSGGGDGSSSTFMTAGLGGAGGGYGGNGGDGGADLFGIDGGGAYGDPTIIKLMGGGGGGGGNGAGGGGGGGGGGAIQLVSNTSITINASGGINAGGCGGKAGGAGGADAGGGGGAGGTLLLEAPLITVTGKLAVNGGGGGNKGGTGENAKPDRNRAGTVGGTGQTGQGGAGNNDGGGTGAFQGGGGGGIGRIRFDLRAGTTVNVTNGELSPRFDDNKPATQVDAKLQ